ncbi:hypothetical protein [Ruminococcus sp. NK3A76]|uniref:hypothetical protein n=1 Tax=Ruminococcus sp. NK3A76 TaxID=877411 RepID=UPI0004908E27|nr:hypothetical protein [Ruminococcus sp. NK3A76]
MREPVMTLYINITNTVGLSSDDLSVNMLHFHARAEGELFSGETVTDGVDTQIFKDGSFSLSARYMLEGTDFKGQKCRVFIENNGTTLLDCKPVIYTDSKALAFLMDRELYALGETDIESVIIRIYQKDQQQ